MLERYDYQAARVLPEYLCAIVAKLIKVDANTLASIQSKNLKD